MTHVTIVAHDGFGLGEVAALTGLCELAIRDRLTVRVQLVGLGRADEFAAAMFGPARRWVSVTPFVGPAHIGRVGRNRYMAKALRREVRRFLERTPTADGIGLPEIRELAGPTDSVRRRSMLGEPGAPLGWEFRRARSRRGDSGFARPFGLYSLAFPTEVNGPICLGYASHFGLGLFVPARS